jgi:hypothetical protein
MEESDIMHTEQRQVELDALLRLLKSAVAELLSRQDADAFLSWMQSQAPELFPELFSGLDDRLVRPFAQELGRQIWNATPLPRNGFEPLVLPQPESQAPPALPGLTPELIGTLVASLMTGTTSDGGTTSEEK